MQYCFKIERQTARRAIVFVEIIGTSIGKKLRHIAASARHIPSAFEIAASHHCGLVRGSVCGFGGGVVVAFDGGEQTVGQQFFIVEGGHKFHPFGARQHGTFCPFVVENQRNTRCLQAFRVVVLLIVTGQHQRIGVQCQQSLGVGVERIAQRSDFAIGKTLANGGIVDQFGVANAHDSVNFADSLQKCVVRTRGNRHALNRNADFAVVGRCLRRIGAHQIVGRQNIAFRPRIFNRNSLVIVEIVHRKPRGVTHCQCRIRLYTVVWDSRTPARRQQQCCAYCVYKMVRFHTAKIRN